MLKQEIFGQSSHLLVPNFAGSSRNHPMFTGLDEYKLVCRIDELHAVVDDVPM